MFALCATAFALSGTQAYADKSKHGEEQSSASGGADGDSRTIRSKVQFKVIGGSDAVKKEGGLTPTQGNWTPPPCWYEPYWDAKYFKTYMEALWDMHDAAGGNPQDIADDKAHYKRGDPYDNFNPTRTARGSGG